MQLKGWKKQPKWLNGGMETTIRREEESRWKRRSLWKDERISKDGRMIPVDGCI